MVQVCTKCSRANPEDACYCYYDGFVLGNGSRNGGPLAIGAQIFNQPFVFPAGRQCRSFDELAIACQEEWPAARDLLHKGYLESFFGGLGRIDLVMAAKEAGNFPDQDRGLDQLLAKLPSDVLAPPKLSVETKEINLGVLHIGDQREFDLQLENQGMRLLHGSVSCADAKDVWLTLGDAPGTTEKHFQFGQDQSIKVKVCGDRLRAGKKPLEAKLLIDSNGGRASIVVRAEVPVKSFGEGSLAGSKTPRDLAMKAKKSPKEAAPFFERGDIETWYKDNGWSYPVKGQTVSGLQAIQQFFEALGLVKPPVVEISTRSISLTGNPGDPLAYEVKVESQEKKYVYAHAVSDQAWLQPEKARFKGQVATIKVAVPSVPNKPGKTLTARLTVESNGNQRFEVPVSLAVQGNPLAFDEPELEPELEVVETVAVAEVETVLPAANITTKAPATPAPPAPVAVAPSRTSEPQTLETMISEEKKPGGHGVRRTSGQTIPLWMHALPAALLGLAVLGVVIFDIVRPLSAGSGLGEIDDPKRPPIGLDLLTLQFHPERHGSFGLEMKHEKDPTDPGRQKRLTYDARGAGDNIIVKIDGSEYFFHQRTSDRPNEVKPLPPLKNGPKRIGQINIKKFKEFDIEVEQEVELIPGASNNRDTCLVLFRISNKSKTQAHKVGLRVLMDTYIGANDGVPFTIPGREGFLDTKEDFREKDIPAYIEVIEKPDTPKDLGTVVRMGLKGLRDAGSDLEPISRMLICLYPGSQMKDWDWEIESMKKNPQNKDSCVALFWAEQTMTPGDPTRVMGYTYGLSELAVGTGESPMALSAPASVQPESEFVMTAYVWNAKKDSVVRLELPVGLTLAKDETEDKKLTEGGNRVQVSWRVKAGPRGEYPVTTKMGTTISKEFKVIVRAGGLFD
jgi:hypothetical protein